MKFDSRKGDKGRVYDANGDEIIVPVCGDTDTGIVEICFLDDNGNAIMDEEKGCMKTEIRRYSAPLTIKPLSHPGSKCPCAACRSKRT